MLLLSVIAAFALEHYFRWGSEYRQFDWFVSLSEKTEELLIEHNFYHQWYGALLVVLLPVIALVFILSLLSGPIYWLLILPISAGILFYSMGPKSLYQKLDQYMDALERGDEESAYLTLKQAQSEASNDIPNSEDPARNATRFILVESHKRYFGVVAWFLFFGPAGALLYRLAHQYKLICIEKSDDNHLEHINQIIHWLDWAPSRLTSFFNLLTGDFVAGFYRFKDYWLESQASNSQLISETGVSALGLQMGVVDEALQENKEAVAMVMRTAIIYIVAVILLSPFSLWAI